MPDLLPSCKFWEVQQPYTPETPATKPGSLMSCSPQQLFPPPYFMQSATGIELQATSAPLWWRSAPRPQSANCCQGQLPSAAIQVPSSCDMSNPLTHPAPTCAAEGAGHKEGKGLNSVKHESSSMVCELH